MHHVCLRALSMQGINMVVLRTHVAYFINQVRSSHYMWQDSACSAADMTLICLAAVWRQSG
jgi:hypothetical protein